MTIKGVLSRFRFLLAISIQVFRSKKIWLGNNHPEVILYERSGAELLYKYIDESKVVVLPPVEEGIHVQVFVLYIWRLLTSRRFMDYDEFFIQKLRPLVLITYIDNSAKFFQLGGRLSGVMTIFIQNGFRAYTGDIFYYLDNHNHMNAGNNVDYMFVYNRHVGELFRKYINGKTLPIGSFKNNMFQPNSVKKKNRILFISQYNSDLSSDGIMWREGGKEIKWKEFYSVEAPLLQYLKEFAKKNDIGLAIAGRGIGEEANREVAFYKDCIGVDGWEYLPRQNLDSSYRYIDQSRIVVSIDSSFIYESLCRGARVAAFSVRQFGGMTRPYPVGWPFALPDEGQFWTHSLEERRFNEILIYLLNATESEWRTSIHEVQKNTIECDPGNVKFIEVLRDLNISLSDDLIELNR